MYIEESIEAANTTDTFMEFIGIDF